MDEALKLFDRTPKWIVYLTLLIVPGSLLLAPLLVWRRLKELPPVDTGS